MNNSKRPEKVVDSVIDERSRGEAYRSARWDGQRYE
jgi:hypothetical protein